MSPNDIERGGQSKQIKEQISGHNYVTGEATVQPGTFREPDQPRPELPGWERGSMEKMAAAVNSAAEKAWDSTLTFMHQHSLAACLICLGTGVLLGRLMSARDG